MTATKTWTPFTTAGACVQRVDHGEDKPLTLDQAVAQVEHPLTGLNRQQLVEVVGYLACQVVGYQHSQNADGALAMAQIRRIVHDFERRESTPSALASPSAPSTDGGASDA